MYTDPAGRPRHNQCVHDWSPCGPPSSGSRSASGGPWSPPCWDTRTWGTRPPLSDVCISEASVSTPCGRTFEQEGSPTNCSLWQHEGDLQCPGWCRRSWRTHCTEVPRTETCPHTPVTNLWHHFWITMGVKISNKAFVEAHLSYL